jgi:hypothetical protein
MDNPNDNDRSKDDSPQRADDAQDELRARAKAPHLRFRREAGDEVDIDEAAASGPPGFSVKPASFHEQTRARFALGLLLIFGLTVVFALGAAAF